MIKQLELKNFTVFKDLRIDFSPKINIIIGENGTGKTHLLKLAYSLCAAPDKSINNMADINSQIIQKIVTDKIVDVFLPLENKLSKLRRSGSEGNAEIRFESSNSHELSCSFYSNSQQIKVLDNKKYERYSYEPVYIPTKEVLSFMEGFTSLYEKYHLSFDRTYFDICNLLDLPKAREERITEKSKWVMEEIEKTVGGKYIFHGGGRVTFKSESDEYSINAMAEGFRKVGMLARLIETGAIHPSGSGPLFWDEPESNMNPKLLRMLVEILLELSRNGQQIIIATHDYVLLKWFDLLMDKGKEDQVRYHVLYRDETSKEIRIDSTDSYKAINPNAIADTYNELTKEQVRQKMGGLGK